MKRWIFSLTFLFLITNIFSAEYDEDWKRLVDLRGQWRFTIGDDLKWANPNFDDSDWDQIFAPSQWEEEGYPGYDGFAWYRKSFKVKEVNNYLYMRLGQIDDVDEVYVNGKMVGLSGGFPPHYNTAYNVDRVYHIPGEYLNKEEANIIAVRVFDDGLEGGIIHGKPGLYVKQNNINYVSSFEKLWKFKTGDSENWKSVNYNDNNWEEILVPMPWEAQGYRDYDGFAWYRIHFTISSKYKNEQLMLLLGKIDDFDEVFLNGEFIDATGFMNDNPDRMRFDDEWLEYRDYKLDSDKINFEGDNVLAVRVFDGLQQGGIYEGPVGIILHDDYREWRKKNNDFFDFFDFFRRPRKYRD